MNLYCLILNLSLYSGFKYLKMIMDGKSIENAVKIDYYFFIKNIKKYFKTLEN